MALPFLPGMSFNDPRQTSYARTQSLNFRNGTAVHDGRTRAAKDSYNHAPPPPVWKTASGETPPPWLAYDKKMLRYDAYFMESIPYSREPYRVRKCIILYYLEDGTLAVNEPKVQNSGLPQGTLVRRHKPTKDDGTPLSYQDINTCMDLKIQGIKYRVYETSDPFTIEFMEQMGYPINGFEVVPADPHTEHREFMSKSLRPTRAAKTGKDPLRQFLDFDGKTLRFYCLLDDPRNRNERRTFMLQFFLADDTLSVVENLPPNCGRDPAPVFAKRQTLPKDFPSLEDISIGKVIKIFNHKFLVYDLDGFTQEYYRENFGVTEFIPIDVSQSYAPIPQMEVPKYNGFGTEEDSLISCLSLVPKPLKKDIRKSIHNDKKVLRFSAKLNSRKPSDALRVFVISYFMADDTLSVYEPPQRNSGIVGGKFLERRRVRRPLKPPTLYTPPAPSSPARPYSAPNNYAKTSEFTNSRPNTAQQTRSPSVSPSLSRSASPYSFSGRGFGFTTTSGGYGYDPRKEIASTQIVPPLSPQRSARNTPPISPAQSRAGTPPLSPSPTQTRNRNMSSPPSNIFTRAHVQLGTLTRSVREEQRTLSRTSSTHEEIEGEYYSAYDFYVGGVIQIFNHVFVLQDADEYVLKHMEARPDEFPVSDINRILERVRGEMEMKCETTSEWLRELDPGRTGFIQIESFKDLLRSICPDLVDQEIVTVCRRYDLDGDGQISHEEFYTAVAPRDDF